MSQPGQGDRGVRRDARDNAGRARRWSVAAAIGALLAAAFARSPKAGLALASARERWFLPGAAGDIGLARSVGARGVLVRTGYGEVELARMDGAALAARVSTDLMEATSWILEQTAAPAGGA